MIKKWGRWWERVKEQQQCLDVVNYFEEIDISLKHIFLNEKKKINKKTYLNTILQNTMYIISLVLFLTCNVAILRSSVNIENRIGVS